MARVLYDEHMWARYFAYLLTNIDMSIAEGWEEGSIEVGRCEEGEREGGREEEREGGREGGREREGGKERGREEERERKRGGRERGRGTENKRNERGKHWSLTNRIRSISEGVQEEGVSSGGHALEESL